MQKDILDEEAGVYAELADRIGVSFRTTELFHGSISDCLAMLSDYAERERADVYIESVDGTIRLNPADIGKALADDGVNRRNGEGPAQPSRGPTHQSRS